MVDIDRLQAEIEAWKRYEWRGDFERTNYTLTMALEAADELRTLRALRDNVEAAPTAWTLSVVEDDEPWLVSNRWAVCEAERRLTGGVLSQAKLVPVENVT